MKMMRWFVGVVVLFLTVFFLIGSPPLQAASATSAPSYRCVDEHPWDIFKNAYRIEIIMITDDYVILAVWFTKDQVQPTIIRLPLAESPRIFLQKKRTITER